MAPIKIGVIGLSTQGWASLALIPPLFSPLLSDKYTLTALCTRSEASATAAAAKFSEMTGKPVKAYYGENGAQELVNDPNVDLVAVSVKVPDHLKASLLAIEAGKDVFIEWIPGKDLKETVQIAEAAKAKGVRAIVGSQNRQAVAVKKAKELIDAGEIGKIVSTTVIQSMPLEFGLGPTVKENYAFTVDVNNGTNLLTIVVGHLLMSMSNILGDLKYVNATGHIQIPTVTVLAADGKPNGTTLPKTTYDQVSLAGVLGGKHDGTFVNIHARAGLASPPGRKTFQWIIDGQTGSIEILAREEEGLMGIANPKILLNGKEVVVEKREEDAIGDTGKAWLEFAKGDGGNYPTLEDAVKVHRVLDAALTSIQQGRKAELI